MVIRGCLGRPDALSSLVIVSGSMAVLREQVFTGISILMVSIWVRTYDLLVCLSVLAWLCWRRELKPSHTALPVTLGITFVQYGLIFLLNAESLVPQLAIWVFLSVVTLWVARFQKSCLVLLLTNWPSDNETEFAGGMVVN